VFATPTATFTSPPAATAVAEGVIVTARFGTDVPPPPPPPLGGGGGGGGGGAEATTVNADALCAVPPGVVTETGPELAPVGTDVSISVGETTANVAAVPLKVTALAPEKLLPAIVTAAPTVPEDGVSDETTGPGTEGLPPTVKSVALCVLPLAVVTVILPVLALDGTEAWICDVETTL
jgi:hypothetical protein